jgi:hypothetical protein
MSADPRHPRAWLERPWVLHPFLVPLPALLLLTSHNLQMLTPAAFLYLYGVCCGVAVFLMLALQALVGNPRKAGAIASILLLALVLTQTATYSWLWLVWAGLVALVAGWRGSLQVLTTFANVAALFAICKPVYDIGQSERQVRWPTYRQDYLTSDAIHIQPATDPPDIYYIVLDAYGRSDVLKRLYGIENKLPAELEKRGFFVADQARSNYDQTLLSLAATLNMNWVETLLTGQDKSSQWRRPLSHLVGANLTVQMLRQAGYRIIDYPSEYSVTHLENADVSRRPWVYFTEFEYTFLVGTPVAAAPKLFGLAEDLTQAVHRNDVRWVLTDLRHGSREEGPAFVFAHLLVPHPPFLFKPDGSYRQSSLPCVFFDGSHWRALAEGSGESYVEGYRAAIEYVDTMVIQAVDGILKSSKRPPIILIQGDHGPGSKLDWESEEGSDLQERLSILSAYYFPDRDYSRLRRSMTPINSFRAVFQHFFGAQVPQLDDRVYFNTWPRPYDPTDVTDLVN